MSLSRHVCDDAPRMAPLPGTHAWYCQQERTDCATLTDIARHIKTLAARLRPQIDSLYLASAPLAALECCDTLTALECCDTLTALAEEIERDDIMTLHEAYACTVQSC
ncbi:hypothetical protein [Acetobacter thailandicus]|uniref:hypothetical protein n=2 Tax=Acetobacter thailandicus TaxID=1502842 RepID=UPI001BA59986|nr:hypothetical protein [Acetobacter thailandicus]MBS0981011.1 hypothetical protein [Acetobacter thailandicus]